MKKQIFIFLLIIISINTLVAQEICKYQSSANMNDVIWKNTVGVTVQGNLIKSDIWGWGMSGGSSVQMLPNSKDGTVSFVVSGGNRPRMLGLSNCDMDSHYNTINHYIYLTSSGQWRIGNGSNTSGVIGNYNTGDEFKIILSNNQTTIKFINMNTMDYIDVSSTPANYMVDIAFLGPTSSESCEFSNVKIDSEATFASSFLTQEVNHHEALKKAIETTFSSNIITQLFIDNPSNSCFESSGIDTWTFNDKLDFENYPNASKVVICQVSDFVCVDYDICANNNVSDGFLEFNNVDNFIWSGGSNIKPNVMFDGQAIIGHEWRHTFCLYECSDVELKNISIENKNGGDCVYIGGQKSITNCTSGTVFQNLSSNSIAINNVDIKDYHRAGISIISVNNITIDEVDFSNESISGDVNPFSDIHIEPNNNYDSLGGDIIITNSSFNDNGDINNTGIWYGVSNTNANTCKVFIENCKFLNKFYAIRNTSDSTNIHTKISLENVCMTNCNVGLYLRHPFSSQNYLNISNSNFVFTNNDVFSRRILDVQSGCNPSCNSDNPRTDFSDINFLSNVNIIYTYSNPIMFPFVCNQIDGSSINEEYPINIFRLKKNQNWSLSNDLNICIPESISYNSLEYSNQDCDTNTIIVPSGNTTNKKPKKNSLVSVFPNPTNDYINIKSSKIISSIIVFDLYGKEVYKRDSDNIKTINISHLNSGVYFIKLNSRDNSMIKKIIKR